MLSSGKGATKKAEGISWHAYKDNGNNCEQQNNLALVNCCVGLRNRGCILLQVQCNIDLVR